MEDQVCSIEKTRREKVTEMLKNRRYKKMTTKISSDTQMVQLAKEDLAFKKQLLEKIEKNDKEWQANLSNINTVMSNIGTVIQQSVGILGQLLAPPPQQTFNMSMHPLNPMFQNQNVSY